MVRMRDVAAVLGVSTTTVSNAFNRPDQLSPELRERILSRAAKTGYYGPHVAGRILRQGRSNTYGVVFMDTLTTAFDDPFKVQWLAGFSDELRGVGASVVLMVVPPDKTSSARAMLNTLVDGIAVTWRSHPIMAMARSHGLPVVGGGPGSSCYVAIDEEAAGREIGQHLRSHGHEHVCIVAGPVARPVTEPTPCTWQDYMAGEAPHTPWARLVGMMAGLSPATVTIVQATHWTRGAGAAAAALALERCPDATALACATDPLALGALDVIRSTANGIAVTGLDGTPEAVTSGLTTVDAHARDQGRLAAQLLTQPTLQPRQIVLDHHLIVRQSSSGPMVRPV